CNPFLMAQLDAVQPAVILALGNFAAQTLLGTKDGITRLRGRPYLYRDIILVPTFHPAFLLRNPGDQYKRMAWDDLKLARRERERLTSGVSCRAPRRLVSLTSSSTSPWIPPSPTSCRTGFPWPWGSA